MYEFWDTRLTFEKSWFARLNYVHQNPVKHGLVPVANQQSVFMVLGFMV
jgi:putative transposase